MCEVIWRHECGEDKHGNGEENIGNVERDDNVKLQRFQRWWVSRTPFSEGSEYDLNDALMKSLMLVIMLKPIVRIGTSILKKSPISKAYVDGMWMLHCNTFDSHEKLVDGSPHKANREVQGCLHHESMK